MPNAAPSPMKPGGKKAASLTEHLRSSAAAKTAAEPPRKLLGGGGLLGGAARVVVTGQPKRAPSARNAGAAGSAITKAGGKGAGLRRQSVATQQAVESAAAQRPRRPAWE